MQTGVAYKMEKDPSDTTPKHLRVGVNSAMVECSALVKIMIDKGILTEEEFIDAMIDQLEKEVAMYTKEIRRLYGADNITLG